MRSGTAPIGASRPEQHQLHTQPPAGGRSRTGKFQPSERNRAGQGGKTRLIQAPQ
jgi:hypothetical protein